MPYRVAVVGSVASGKSSIINSLQADCVKFEEPIDQWNQVPKYGDQSQSHQVFDLFYRDQASYAFPFQSLVMATYAREFQAAMLTASSEKKPLVLERVFDEQYQIFATCLYQSGKIDNLSMSILRENCLSYMDLKPELVWVDILAFLETPKLEVQMQRIAKRNRPGEIISTEYMKSLNDRYYWWQKDNFGLVQYKKLLRFDTETHEPKYMAAKIDEMLNGD